MGLGKIFWGLVLWFFDFRLNGFDLLPDAVGLLLVASGSLGLRAGSRRFSSASTLCFVLAGLWPLEFVDTRPAAVALGLVAGAWASVPTLKCTDSTATNYAAGAPAARA